MENLICIFIGHIWKYGGNQNGFWRKCQRCKIRIYTPLISRLIGEPVDPGHPIDIYDLKNIRKK